MERFGADDRRDSGSEQHTKKTLFTAIIVRVFIGRTAKNLYLYDMETALENLSKEDLIKVISSRDEALAERDKK